MFAAAPTSLELVDRHTHERVCHHIPHARQSEDDANRRKGQPHTLAIKPW